MAEREGLSLGQLLLALDRTMVTLVEAPRGLDMPVGSVALVDVDDIRLGLAVGAGSADLFFLLGVSDAEAVGWIAQAGPRRRPGSSRRQPLRARRDLRQGAVARRGETGRGARHRGGRRRTARPVGAALQTGQPRVRAPRRPRRPAQRLRHRSVRAGAVDRRAHPRDDQHRGRPVTRAGLFGVQRGGRRTAQADHPRPRRAARTSGMDRPVGHLRRAAGQRRRRARRRTPGAGPAAAARGGHPPARDGCATAAAVSRARSGCSRVRRRWPTMSRRCCAAGPCWRRASCRGWRLRRRRTRSWCRTCSGSARTPPTSARSRSELGIAADGRAALVGFRAEGTAVPANVIALSASAFRADAQVASTGERVYVLLPKIGATSSLTSWVRGMVAALRRELGLTMRAVIAAPLTGLAGAAAARAEVDRVFDSADRHPGAIGQVTSLDEAHTTVLLDEIVAHVAGRQRLVDPRVRELREQDPMLADTLAAYLDGFGDIAAVAQRLHVHPNTVRYRDPSNREAVVDVVGRPRRPTRSRPRPASDRTALERQRPATSSSNRSMASSPSASRPRSGPRSARYRCA